MAHTSPTDPEDLEVAHFMERVAAIPAPFPGPDPAFVWCKARLLQRRPDRPAVLRWLTIAEALEIAACAATVVMFTYLSWSALLAL